MSRLFILLVILSLSVSCKKGTLKDNQPPETEISLKSINLTGNNRLNSVITLNWLGTDGDGFVTGYELSFDEKNWVSTNSTDSTFRFSIDAGSDTVDIEFFVRAIDNDQNIDPTPAYLKIPLKNTPPTVVFKEDLQPEDTALIVSTISWTATDLDGNNTLDSVLIRANNGTWFNIPLNYDVVSLLPVNTSGNGPTGCKIITADGTELPGELDGLSLNASNTFYVKTVDIAGSSSDPDTAESVYVRSKVNDWLLINGHSAPVISDYTTRLGTAGQTVDVLDWAANNGIYQPKYWNTTTELIFKQYETIVFVSDDGVWADAITNTDRLLLEHSATALQTYIDDGGKLFVTAAFPNTIETSNAAVQILPIDSFSGSTGQARLPTDSLVVGKALTGGTAFPDLTSGSFIVGLDPFYPSADAEVIYTGQVAKVGGWTGPDVLGVRRTNTSGTNLIFLSFELHKADKNPTELQNLFNRIVAEL